MLATGYALRVANFFELLETLIDKNACPNKVSANRDHLHLRLHPTFLVARPPHPLSFHDAEEGPVVYNVRSRGIGLR
jgi:hypothetical protein